MLHHYLCIQAIYSKKKSLLIIDTVEYLHEYLTKPNVTEEDRMTHTIHFLSVTLKYVPNSICNSQLAAIEAVREIFENWRTVESLILVSTTEVPPHINCTGTKTSSAALLSTHLQG